MLMWLFLWMLFNGGSDFFTSCLHALLSAVGLTYLLNVSIEVLEVHHSSHVYCEIWHPPSNVRMAYLEGFVSTGCSVSTRPT